MNKNNNDDKKRSAKEYLEWMPSPIAIVSALKLNIKKTICTRI